jgi:erythromycin esterase
MIGHDHAGLLGDEDLLHNIAHGCIESFNLLYLRFQRSLLNFLPKLMLSLALGCVSTANAGPNRHSEPILSSAGSINSNRLPTVGPDESDVFLTWAKSHAHRINSAEPGTDLADLAAMKDLIGSARIVGVGESIHGIHEFLGLRLRMVQFLVEKMGFTSVALESGLPESKIVYDYVLGGEKDPNLWTDGFTWHMAIFGETRELVEWMRSYNLDPRHTRKIRFYGMDVAGANGTWVPALNRVLAYLDKVEPVYAKDIRERLLPLAEKFAKPGFSAVEFTAANDAYSALSLEERNAIGAYSNELADRIEQLRLPYIASSSEEEYDWARQIAINLRYASALLTNYEARTRGNALWNARDLAMSVNVRWMRERDGQSGGVVVLAHNGHVQMQTSSKAAANGACAGIFLKTIVGDDYRNVGFTFNKGSMWDGEPGNPKPLHEATADTIDGAMARVGLSLYFINLRQVSPESPARKWLDRQIKQRIQDLSTEYNQYRSWDGLIFVDSVTPSHLAKKP